MVFYDKKKILVLLQKTNNFYSKIPNVGAFKTFCIVRLQSAMAKSTNLLTTLVLIYVSSALDRQVWKDDAFLYPQGCFPASELSEFLSRLHPNATVLFPTH